LRENNFSNQKQVELLQILNFTLYKKNYQQDLCGILERKSNSCNSRTKIQQPKKKVQMLQVSNYFTTYPKINSEAQTAKKTSLTFVS
jgi:hypothetical protein